MATIRAALARLMSTGVISAARYSVLTGLALLYLTYMLRPWSSSQDPALPYVAPVLAALGLWQLGKGVKGELDERRRPHA